jgi:hypothetical protein
MEVPRNFHPYDDRLIAPGLLRCEQLSLSRLPRTLQQDSDLDSLITRKVGAFVLPAAAGATETPEPRAYVGLPAIGGFEGTGIEPLADELADALLAPTMQAKIAKLAASGLEERHLFLWVRPTAFSFPVYLGLAFGGPLPSRPPRLPIGLNQVWLLTGIAAGGGVRAAAAGAWQRDAPLNDLSQTIN